jgi:outer membrane protein assembly factor BamB
MKPMPTKSLELFAVLTALAAMLTVSAQAADWTTYGGGPSRLFYNAGETQLNASTIDRLDVRWTYNTAAIVTAAATVADVVLPVEGLTSVAFVQSWDGFMYALRVSDGSVVWLAALADETGASYPNAGSVHVEDIGGSLRVIYGAGQTVLCLDAASGVEIWRFDAGTGCLNPPNTCGFDNERNEVISSPIVADGKVIFGMDVNDVATGKGGVYALDETDGRMLWFFDLESGGVCEPDPGDNIRRFDGYHSELELGLPAGFLATRSGCDFDRTPTGCGNVWSSPAVDDARQLIYIASSNCDTDNDAGTTIPPPPMPPYDQAIFALNYDGSPAWRWRPREIDNDDLAFGATPQLFTIDFGGLPREVVGIGNKDGTYYVIDRDGVNEVSGVAWDDVDPSTLPYWFTNLVPGGVAGGIIGTPSVDESSKRIYINTAPGFDPLNPQQPTVHALNLDDGTIAWQNTAEGPLADSSFAPTSGIPGFIFVGSVRPPGKLRVYDSATGTKVLERQSGFSVASAATVVDGTLIIGDGVGERNDNPTSPSNVTSMAPSVIVAFCAIATEGCPANLLGKKLLVKDRLGDANKRKIVALAKDATHVLNPQAAFDPTVVGGQLRVLNPVSAEEQIIPLPSANWSGVGKPAGSKGYKYKDSKRLDGPCKSVQIKPGKLVKVNCSGVGVTFSLDEATQGEISVSLDFGGMQEIRYCMRFGGEVAKDEGTGVSKSGNAQFKAKSAPRPNGCD